MSNRKEKLEKIPEIGRRYLQGEEISSLSEEYGIPTSTLWYHFRRLGIHRTRTAGISIADRVIKEESDKDQAKFTEAIHTIGSVIGGVISRRYLALIDYLMAEGKTLENIAEDIMSWYEQKSVKETRIKDLEIQNIQLTRDLDLAWGIAAPNFRYFLKTTILNKYAKDLLRAKKRGLPISPAKIINALNNDLEKLDQDFEEAIIHE